MKNEPLFYLQIKFKKIRIAVYKRLVINESSIDTVKFENGITPYEQLYSIGR